jgi:uncharacterized membrane protein
MGSVRLRLRVLWFRLRESYWFLPALMTALAVALSTATIAVDVRFAERGPGGLVWVYAGGPDGARAVLATVAASMITVTALVFSITIVALSFASSQLGPRLLVSFMRDTGNQLVLGTFVATFLYCLLVLRTVQSGPGAPFVPHLSVTVAVALTVASLGVLVYFIHHVAVGIQADAVIATVSRDLEQAIDALFPEMLGREPPEPARPGDELPADFEIASRPVVAPGTGYIRAIDGARLLRVASDRDLLVSLARRPGHFVTADLELARVWPADRVDEAVVHEIARTAILGDRRTLEQDVEFAVNQLVEVALRALSPGVNDPFTALTCVDRLGAALARLAGRVMPSRYRYDESGTLRIVTGEVSFAGVVDAAFDQIRQAARANVAVTVRLLETIGAVLIGVRREGDAAALLRQAAMIWRAAEAAVSEPGDRAAIEERYGKVEKSAEGGTA